LLRMMMRSNGRWVSGSGIDSAGRRGEWGCSKVPHGRHEGNRAARTGATV